MDISTTREALISRLGRFPERVPFEPISSPPIDEGEYTRALVTYQVEPGSAFRPGCSFLVDQRLSTAGLPSWRFISMVVNSIWASPKSLA